MYHLTDGHSNRRVHDTKRHFYHILLASLVKTQHNKNIILPATMQWPENGEIVLHLSRTYCTKFLFSISHCFSVSFPRSIKFCRTRSCCGQSTITWYSCNNITTQQLKDCRWQQEICHLLRLEYMWPMYDIGKIAVCCTFCHNL